MWLLNILPLLSEEIVCENCGSLTEPRNGGIFCVNCDWSVVTTYIPEIVLDLTLYNVDITSGDYQNLEHIKTVSRISGVNFLIARKFLQRQSPFSVYKGLAINILEIREMLNKVGGLTYQINPIFPWE
jgi:hypothetical protein